MVITILVSFRQITSGNMFTKSKVISLTLMSFQCHDKVT